MSFPLPVYFGRIYCSHILLIFCCKTAYEGCPVYFAFSLPVWCMYTAAHLVTSAQLCAPPGQQPSALNTPPAGSLFPFPQIIYLSAHSNLTLHLTLYWSCSFQSHQWPLFHKTLGNISVLFLPNFISVWGWLTSAMKPCISVSPILFLAVPLLFLFKFLFLFLYIFIINHYVIISHRKYLLEKL